MKAILTLLVLLALAGCRTDRPKPLQWDIDPWDGQNTQDAPGRAISDEAAAKIRRGDR